MNKSKTTTVKITLIALMASMCAALGFISIDLGNMKFSFESLPVIISGLMFGPLAGFSVGGIGTFTYQIVRYGFSYTTILWMMPYMIIGLCSGLYARNNNYSNTKKQLWRVTIVSEILILILNTIVLIIDAKIYGYYKLLYIIGGLPLRAVSTVIKIIIFGFVIPKLLISFSRITGNGLDNIKGYK